MSEQNKTAEEIALQEAKQQVAKKNQFPTWQDLLDTYKDRFNVACTVHEQHAYQLAHFYASQQTASLQKQLKELQEEFTMRVNYYENKIERMVNSNSEHTEYLQKQVESLKSEVELLKKELIEADNDFHFLSNGRRVELLENSN